MKRTHIVRTVIGFGLTVGVVIPARAQPQSVRLTLDEAIARGLEASHRVAEAAATREASEAAVAGSQALRHPQVSAAAGVMRTNHVTEFGIPQPGGPLRVIFPDIPDNYWTRLTVEWPIYTGGRADALLRAARADAGAAGRELETARTDLRLEITRAYWALATAIETVRVFEEALRRVEAHLTDARNRQAVGLVPPSDVLSVETQRSRQQGRLIEARNLRDVATADLARLVGLPPEALINLELVLAPAVAPREPEATLVETSRAARPERRALLDRLAAAGARHAASLAADRPQVSVKGGVDYANPNPRIFPRADRWQTSWDAGVSVSWSLWDGGRVRAQVAETTAAARAINERLLEFDSRLAVEIRQRRLEIESSLAALAAAGDGVGAAAEARRVLTERYGQGVATSTDVLDAQVALLEAELDRMRTIAANRLAEARLNRALGR